MRLERLTLDQVQNVQTHASQQLAEGREGRLDPVTSPTHLDHWLHELPGYVMSDLAEGKVASAQDMTRLWLDSTTADGRTAHMIIDDSSWRRRHIDRRVQMSVKAENGSYISPFSGPPVLSTCALKIAEALPESERQKWAQEVFPKLTKVKRFHYNERDIYDEGLPVQIHPDEVLLRHGRISDAALGYLPGSKLTDFERLARNLSPLQRIAKTYRHWQGDDSRRGRSKDGSTPTYDSEDFMKLDTASRVYTLLGTVRRNDFDARQLVYSRGRNGAPDGYIVQDPAVTGMLLADNQALTEIAKLAGQKLPSDIEIDILHTEENASLHWNHTAGKFAARLPQRKIWLSAETGIESSLMLLSLGGTALKDEHVDKTIRDAYTAEHAATLVLPTARVGNQQEAGMIDRGGFSPQLNLLLHQTLVSYEGNREAAMLKSRIGHSIVAAFSGSNMFARQYNSITGQPLGQSVWNPSAAAALVVSTELLSS